MTQPDTDASQTPDREPPHRESPDRRTVPVRLSLLVAAVVACLGLLAPLAIWLDGTLGLLAAAIAAAACLLGAAGALVVDARFPGVQYALHRVLGGAILRMAVPLAVALPLHLADGPLAGAGLVYYLLAFYPLCLAIDTALTLPQKSMPGGSRGSLEGS